MVVGNGQRRDPSTRWKLVQDDRHEVERLTVILKELQRLKRLSYLSSVLSVVVVPQLVMFDHCVERN